MNRFLFLLFFTLTGLAPAQGLPDLTATSPARGTVTLKGDSLGAGREVRVVDPNNDSDRIYLAVPLTKLLDDAFGPAWKQPGSDLIFHCSDGYRCVVPSSTIQEHTAYLAYARKGGEPFQVYSKAQHRTASLAPYYLIWDSGDDVALQEVGSSLWPYQIVKIELEPRAEVYAGVTPPEGSSEQVRKGFEAFGRYCLSCHTMNGRGGSRAPDLNYPVNVTEYFDESWLFRLIDEPRDLRWNATMPGLNRKLPNREQTIRDIIAYLKSMRDKKIAPTS